MAGNERSLEFQTPEIMNESDYKQLLHTILKDIRSDLASHKVSTDQKLDAIYEDINELRSQVDRLGIDHIFSDIQSNKAKLDDVDKRVGKLENYHNRILAVVAFSAFLLAVIGTVAAFLR